MAAVRRLRDKGCESDIGWGSSWLHKTQEAAKALLGDRPVDALFIDGNHSGYGVFADMRAYVPLVAKGGLVMFHDVGPCPGPNMQTLTNVNACFAAWKDLALRHTRKLIVQANVGYGLVWLDRKESG